MREDSSNSPSAAAAVPVTELLVACREGDPQAEDLLFDRVYSELRRIAGAQVRMRSTTMLPTELVHETYLKLLGDQVVNARDRGHFFALAARAMRHILVDAARRKTAQKRGGNVTAVKIDEGAIEPAIDDNPMDVLALDEALIDLQEVSPRSVQIVELRHFAGLSVEETARELGCSTRTVKRDWRSARAFLFDRLRSATPTSAAQTGSTP